MVINDKELTATTAATERDGAEAHAIIAFHDITERYPALRTAERLDGMNMCLSFHPFYALTPEEQVSEIIRGGNSELQKLDSLIRKRSDDSTTGPASQVASD